MGILGKIRKKIKKIDYSLLGDPSNYEVGSQRWLAATEKYFGGIVKGVPRNSVSELDPRSENQILSGGMTGGDRMFHHDYAMHYADGLSKFLSKPPSTIVEVGILKGTGLAVWGELFPDAEILGLDVDPKNFIDNYDNLKKLGAFKKNEPEIYTFDQFLDGKERMDAILSGRKVDIFIDDGFHSDETILNTAHAIKPFLNDEFVCFIEDNATVSGALAELFIKCRVISDGELTVISS